MAAGMYPPAAYVAAASVVHVPIAAIETGEQASLQHSNTATAATRPPPCFSCRAPLPAAAFFSIVLFFMVGLQPGEGRDTPGGRWAFFYLVLFLVDLCMGAMFRLFAYVLPNMEAAQTAPGPVIALQASRTAPRAAATIVWQRRSAMRQPCPTTSGSHKRFSVIRRSSSRASSSAPTTWGCAAAWRLATHGSTRAKRLLPGATDSFSFRSAVAHLYVFHVHLWLYAEVARSGAKSAAPLVRFWLLRCKCASAFTAKQRSPLRLPSSHPALALQNEFNAPLYTTLVPDQPTQIKAALDYLNATMFDPNALNATQKLAVQTFFLNTSATGQQNMLCDPTFLKSVDYTQGMSCVQYGYFLLKYLSLSANPGWKWGGVGFLIGEPLSPHLESPACHLPLSGL